MTPDDEIPEDDPLADATRRALGRLGGAPALDDLSWDAVETRARRVKTQRITALVAACAIVVVGLGAAVATTKSGSDHVSVAGRGDDNTTTTASTTTTATTTTTTPPLFVAPTVAVAPGTGPSNQAPTTAPAANQVVQPQDGSWEVAITSDATSVKVGDAFTVSAALTNTGTQLQSTDGYGSWAIACSWATESTSDPGPPSLPIGGFPDGAILRPGESQTVSQTFTAQADQVGLLRCGAGVVFHGDAQFADTSNGVVIEVVALPVTTTTVVTTEPTTTTTAP
jgi:hypothetical protein